MIRGILSAHVAKIILGALLIASVPAFVTAQPLNTAAGTKPKPTPKPKFTPTPTPAPTPVDARRDWGNTGTDFNSNASWSAGTGGVAPGVGDVAWFTTSAITQPNLSASLSITGLYFNGTGSSGYSFTNSGGAALTLTGYATSIGDETGDSNSVAIGGENVSGTNTLALPIILASASGTNSTIFQAGGGTLVLSGNISGSANLIKTGAGTLVLSGNNSYSGATVLDAGQININSATAIGTGLFEIGNTGTSIDNTSGAAITLTNNNEFLLDGGDLTFVGTNNLNLGTGTFVLDGATRTVSVTNINATLTIGGIISGDHSSRGLTKSGAGTLVVSDANTYGGVTTIRQGRLIVSNLANDSLASSIGASSSIASNFVIGGGGSSATLLYNGSGSSTDRLFTLDSGTNIFDSSGTGALNFTGVGPISFAGTGNRSLSLTGSNTGENTLAPIFGDPSGGVFAVVKTGTGTWNLTNTNTYTGTTFIGEGTLGFNSGSLGTGLINFTSPPTAATLRWNSGNTEDVSSRLKINDGVTATINTNGNNVTFASAIQTQSVNGSGALIKAGAGTLTLAAANTYSGGTSVNGGTLLVNNTSGSGTGSGVVTVNSGGTLGGVGTISGAVMVNGGGTLAPGTSPGILNTGALTLSSSSTFSLDLNGGSGVLGTGAGTLYDQVAVTGTITLGGNLAVTIGATPVNVGDKFFVALNDGAELVSGTFANATGGIYTSGSNVFLVNYADNGDGTFNDISLTVTAVPEPGTWIGGSLALATLLFGQRRRFARLVKL